MVKATVARGGGRAFPQRHRTEATSPKAALTPLASLPGQRQANFRACDEMSQHLVIAETQATVFALFSAEGSKRAGPFFDRELANRIDRQKASRLTLAFNRTSGFTASN